MIIQGLQVLEGTAGKSSDPISATFFVHDSRNQKLCRRNFCRF